MKERILVLEDDDKLRLTLSQVLQGEGYRVDEAANGTEAIRLAAAGGYDLVIADIRMEGVDGLEALARMKERHPEMRSLVMTGYSTEEDSIRAIRLGVGDYLRKPFRFDELMDSVQRLLALRRQEVQQAAQQALMRRSLLRASQATARSLDLMGMPGRPKEGLLSVLPLAERLARARGLSAEASETVQLGACMLALNRCDGEAAALVDEEELPPSLRLCLQGEGETLEARIVAFVVALAYGEQPEDPELTDLLAKDSDETQTNGEQLRSLLSLGQALEAAGQTHEAGHAYRQICANSSASREWVQAALGQLRLESNPQLLAEKARQAVDAAQAVGPGVSAQSYFECGLLLLQRGLAAGENLLLQAGRLYRELNFPSYQALATLAVSALGTQAVSEDHQAAALELLARPEFREEVLRHQNWLATWLLDSPLAGAAGAQRIVQRWLQDGASGLVRSLQQGRLSGPARARLLEGLKKAPSPSAALAELLAGDPALQAEASALLPGAAPVAPSEVRILTLGPLEVFRGQERVPNSAWRSQKSRFLLAFLAVQAGKPVSEDVLIDMFWPDDAEKGKRSLYWVSSMIRNCLRGDDEIDPILRHQGMLALNPQLPRWHDLEQMEQLIQRPEGDKADCWRRGVALYRGPFLEGCYMDWAEPVRLRAFSTVCEALLNLAQWAQQAGRPAESLEHARRLWDLDPCRQDACQLAMQALQALGRSEEAVRLYERCRKALQRELEMEPGLPLLEAHQRALMSLSS